MSKGKRVKSGAGTQSSGGAKWEQALLAAPFEEDNWKPNITFVVGKKPEDYWSLDILGATVAGGSRKLFSVISKSELFEEVNELGNPKGKKTKEVPPHFEVCEPCKTHLDNKEDIPLPLLARLIKFKLLAIKAKDHKRRETERKAAADKEKAKKSAEKGGGAKEKPKSPAKGGKGGKKTPEPQASKEGSKLRKRGDEEDDGKYIDDEPDDGSSHYIIIHGFHSPHLFSVLAGLDINVQSIISLGSQDYRVFHNKDNEAQDDKALVAAEALQEERLKVGKELKVFWNDTLTILRRQSEGSKLHDIAFRDYEVKSLVMPENLEDQEQKNQFGGSLFEDIACLIYDLQDAKRQYLTYLENLNLIQIPVYGKTQTSAKPEPTSASGAPTPLGQAPALSTGSPGPDLLFEPPPPVDMRYYNDLMACIPNESVSVPLIMHCMLEQVVASEENVDPPSEQMPTQRDDGLNSELARHLSKLTFKLALTEEEHGLVKEVFDMPERPPDTAKQPLLMNIFDSLSTRTQHLKSFHGFDPIVAEKEMLENIYFKKILELPRPNTQVAKERAARLQELIHFCATGGLSPSEIDRGFKQFVFECMDLTTTDPNGFIVTCDSEGVLHSAIPWDDPYPFFRGMIPKHPHKDIISVSPDRERSGAQSPTPYHKPAKTVDSGHIPRSMTEKKTDQGQDSRSTSSDSRKGILRPSSRTSTPDKKSTTRSNSVHFGEKGHAGLHPHFDTEQVGPEETQEEEEELSKSPEDSMNEIIDAQKRQLDEWCFAEHYEPHVLLQILKEAHFDLPFVDIYYHKRDHSLMLVLHNPYSLELQSHIDWHTELHSNLGFRNYLEYVSESIADWVKEEEAKYQAHLLSKELERMREEEEMASRASDRSKSRAKSPKKAGSRGHSPKSSRSSSADRPSSSDSRNMFIREGSLKAWKLEQDRMKEEEEEMERTKSAKRTKSPKKKDEDKDKKRPGSRGSAKSKRSQVETEPEPQQDLEPQVEEKYWPFTGYDVGNNLVHVSGITTTLFPTDGGQIRSERTEFTQGSVNVKTSVIKDGHIFTVHVGNPLEPEEDSDGDDADEFRKEEPEKAETERSEKEDDRGTRHGETGSPFKKSISGSSSKRKSVSEFGSITGHMKDGMTLAFSQFGATGESVDGKKKQPEPYIPPVSSLSPVPPPSSPAKSSKKSKDKGASTPEPVPQPVTDEEPDKEDEKKDEEKPVVQSFQQLYVTCPDGLNVQYFLESSVGVKPLEDEDRKLLVKQSFPFSTKGMQSCEAVRKKYASTELSRVITSEGTVVKTMVDGSVQVLYADGTVSTHTGPWPVLRSGSSTPRRSGSARSQTGERAETPTKKGTSKNTVGKGEGVTIEGDPILNQYNRGTWETTFPSGERMAYRPDGTTEELRSVMVCVASDPETTQSMATRDDHVITISYPDGTTIIEHEDGTRTTTYYRESTMGESEEDSQIYGESQQSEVQMIKFVKVECPGYATVEFNCSTSESLTVFGNNTNINIFPDGYYMLHHQDGGRLEVDTEGTATYYPRLDKNMEQLLPERELQYVLRHNADVVVETVDSEGNVFNIKYNGDYTVLPATGDEASETSSDNQDKPDKRMMAFKEHAPRFFIVHSDCSGTELLRYQDVAEYLLTAEQNPATAVLRDELPDYPGVTGITILKPYLGGPSEKWLKKYDQESIIPSGIRCRDLTTLPPKEFKPPGPRFGTNVGKGLSVGTAIRQPTRIPILKCPDVLELRQLVQYKPMSEDLRQHMQSGLREYAEYVMARNKSSKMLQLFDPRTEEERIHAEDLQALASSGQEVPQYKPADIKSIYEKATTPSPPSPPPTPQPKRTKADWERDQREISEEIEGRFDLRNKKIPPYFESEFGKAFLLTQAKDINEMMQQLSEDPRHDGTEAVRGDMSSPSYQQKTSPSSGPPAQSVAAHTSHSDQSSRSSPTGTAAPKGPTSDTPVSYAVFSEITTAGVRPGNPTPAHATGQGSPAPVRPQNPTPGHAVKASHGRPINPTPKKATGTSVDSPSDLPSQMDYPIILEQPTEEEDPGNMPLGDTELILTRSLKVNVLGQPRTTPVLLPSVIKGGKPGAIPNTKFQAIEDPVRRHVKNSVVAGATVKGQTQLTQMRGLILLPEEVDFGVLKEGNMYSYTVFLKNTGVDSCRFKVKQPPPATGIRVIFQPGPIAAGMKANLNLEIYAIAVGVEGESGVGSIRHDLEIITETDILFLPLTATVLTAHEYENRGPNSPKGGKAPGTKLTSTKPPATTGIIRPRKNKLHARTIFVK